MTFLHLWAIGLGAAAAALPVIIHWLTRPRPVRLPFSTIRFVQEVVEQRRARKRLRDWIILALRTLAVLCLGWAIARPLLGDQSPPDSGEAGEVARVVLVDASQSMAAQSRGIQNFERARPLAASYLADRVGLEVNLVMAAAVPRPAFDRLSTNLPALRDELAHSQPLPERLNVQASINLASEMLARAALGDAGRRELVVISDFQRSSWNTVDLSVLPEGTRVQLDSVAPQEPLANLAVLRVASQGRVEQGREARLEVEVGNFSPSPRRVQVDLLLGRSQYRLEGHCPANNRTVLSTNAVLPNQGWLVGEARLVGAEDALADDDNRAWVLNVRPEPTFALLTSQPGDLRPSSSYYVERALVPSAPSAGRSEGRVIRIDPAHVDREMLADADLIVLDHPGRLAPETIQLLASLVRRGRGLLYFAAEANDATNLKLFADASGSDFQLPVEFQPSAGPKRRDLFLAEVRRDLPPFAVFGDGFQAIAGNLRFTSGLASRRMEGALADDVLASYSDRSASLVMTECGAGTVGVFNADLASSNLPTSPAFVPLVGELVGRFLQRHQAGGTVVCGEPMTLLLPVLAGPAEELSASGPRSLVDPASQFVAERGGVFWRRPSAPTPGAYRVEKRSQTVFAVASVLPPDESDLRSMEPAVLVDRIAAARNVHYRSAAVPAEERDSAWIWLAVACVVCLLAELIVLRIFRT